MSKRILIDIDGTIADWEAKFIELMSLHHPHIELIPHGVRNASTAKQESLIRSLPETQEILAMEGFYGTLELFDGATDTLQHLVDDGHEVYLCTMPSRSNRFSSSEKYEWVANNLGEQWVENTILTYKKHLVNGDFLIDDHIQPSTPSTTWEQIIYTQSYNTHIENTLRMSNWLDYNHLNQLISK